MLSSVLLCCFPLSGLMIRVKLIILCQELCYLFEDVEQGPRWSQKWRLGQCLQLVPGSYAGVHLGGKPRQWKWTLNII